MPAQEGVRFSCRSLKYEGNDGGGARLRWRLSSQGCHPPTLDSSSLHLSCVWITDDAIVLKRGTILDSSGADSDLTNRLTLRKQHIEPGVCSLKLLHFIIFVIVLKVV